MNCYGTLTLIEHSPVASLVEPLTLAEIKNYLRLPELSPADTADDDLLETLIIAARETAEIYQGRDLIEKRYLLTYDYWPEEIRLRAPLVTVHRVRYRDDDGDWTTLTETTDYIIDTRKQPGIILPPVDGSWPTATLYPTSAIETEFTSGYDNADIFWGSSGQRVLKGMKLLISHWFNGRLPFIDTRGGGIPVEMPYAVTALLSMGAIPNV